MSDGFTIDLDEAERGCRSYDGSLPQAALMLREPVADLLDHAGWDGRGRFDAVDRMRSAYRLLSEELGDRQIRGCDVMEDTAEALREIIAVYRRVDGQV
ncbi:MAG TPA: hypothetical protein VFV67_02320 [Actinophytocola sp.]|uniref:hypothetical protein n=1 Tax=Actinophytocola sp. TaxID=1872138 RepID=UPI002DB88230|nr:hypothetical protein [Actinophytocola sp.]HEU5469461.1 hypothetical protein [Actinophytocola sp.]